MLGAMLGALAARQPPARRRRKANLAKQMVRGSRWSACGMWPEGEMGAQDKGTGVVGGMGPTFEGISFES